MSHIHNSRHTKIPSLGSARTANTNFAHILTKQTVFGKCSKFSRCEKCPVQCIVRPRNLTTQMGDESFHKDYSVRALLADSWGCSHYLEDLPSLFQSQFLFDASTALDFFQSVCEMAKLNVGKRLQKTCQTRLQKDVVFRWCWGWIIKVGLTHLAVILLPHFTRFGEGMCFRI